MLFETEVPLGTTPLASSARKAGATTALGCDQSAPLSARNGDTLSSASAGTQASAARRRKLHLGHFAFMRSVVQGLDPRASWERYLRVEGQADDQRAVRSTIAWIRDEFAAAAKREDRHGTARLVRIDAARIVDPAASLPSLEQFAEEQGLEDESQAEQIAAFEQKYGRATHRQRKRAELIKRQLEALRWLERLLAQSPRSGDSVAAWLNPSLANHLEAADIFTLAQLVERVNGVGLHWHASIKALGARKAQRIVGWLQDVANFDHSDGLLRVGRHVALPRAKLAARELNAIVVAATDIRPLEKFIVPAALDGSHGAYRRPQAQCLLGASNDHAAILAWLGAKRGPMGPLAGRKGALHNEDLGRGADMRSTSGDVRLSHTQRSYRKEAERFLLWAIVLRGKALSSMTAEDCVAYRAFVADPQPLGRWCGPRSRQRWSPAWRPFEGPLSTSGQRQAVTILKNLYAFLVDQNYLVGNPWSALAVPRSARPALDVGRSLTKAQWQFVLAMAAEAGTHSSARRLRLALGLLYATGLRTCEIVAAKVGDLQAVEYTDPGHGGDGQLSVTGWMLTVVGKGQRIREVPVPTALIDRLVEYLDHRGLDRSLNCASTQEAYILGQVTDGATQAPGLFLNRTVNASAGIVESTLYGQIKGFFAKCSMALRIGADGLNSDPAGADRLLRASTHWLRHSHASHALASGMKIEVVQQNLGHASLSTTTAYVTTEKAERLKAMQGFWNPTP